MVAGWPWTLGHVPPISYDDCADFFFACTDYHQPGKLSFFFITILYIKRQHIEVFSRFFKINIPT